MQAGGLLKVGQRCWRGLNPGQDQSLSLTAALSALGLPDA